MKNGESSTRSRRNFGILAVTVGVGGSFLLLSALAGCGPILQYIAESITGVPLEGFPTATPTVVSTATSIPSQTVAATPTPTSTTSGRVRIKTNMGDVVVEMNPAAPVTVANFLHYVDTGFYSNLIFHRSVQSSIFIVQGGGFYANGSQPSTFPPIILEDDKGLNNVRGTIAMARTGVYDSATSQFFFNVQDNPSLNRSGSTRGYAVFGTVVSGMSVVDAMAALPILDASAVNSAFNQKPCPGGDLNASVIINSVTRE